MKEKNSSLKLRVLAFVTLILFTVTSCPIPSLPEPDAMMQGTHGFGSGEINRPVSFHLDDDYQPSATETGKTAFILRGVEAAKNFMITAETEDDGIVVRFLASDTDTIVSLYFDKVAQFPCGFAMNAGGDTAYGVFSDYKENETFDLMLKSNGETETFKDIVMNKNVLSAYQKNDDFSLEHNERMRAYVTALGVWMAVTLHFDRETAENQVSAVPSAVSGGTNPLAGFSLNDEESGFRKAIENISGLGAAAGAFFPGVFAGTAAAVIAVGADIKVVVAAPVVAVIAGVTAVAATVVYLEDTYPPNQPPAQLNAPHLRFYYFDESGEEQPIPVMRTDAEPLPAQSVYIEPNGRGSDYTSNVRLYYQVTRSGFADDQVTDKPTLNGVITPYGSKDNKHYQAVLSGTDEKGDYFEVQKSDGFIGTDARRQTKLVFTVYDSSQPGKTPYPSFSVNGTEFEGVADFAISFFDYVTDSEKAEVVILPHTETEIIPATVILQNQWLDLGVLWTPLISLMDSIALTVLAN